MNYMIEILYGILLLSTGIIIGILGSVLVEYLFGLDLLTQLMR